MTEDKAREIHTAKDLSPYSHKELQLADAWVKEYAIKALEAQVSDMPKALRDYILLMVRVNYGSMETDHFLSEMNCYPSWVIS